MKKIIIFSVLAVIVFVVLLFGIKYMEFSNYVGISGFNTTSVTNVSMDGNFLSPNITIKGYIPEIVKAPSLNSKEVYSYRITKTYIGTKEDKFVNFIKFFIAEFVPEREWKVKIEIDNANDSMIEGQEEVIASMDKSSCKPITKFLINKRYGWIKEKTINMECIYDVYGRMYPEKNYSLEESEIYSNILGREPSWYSKWMSALDEGFSWTQVVERNMSLNTTGKIISRNEIKNITLIHCSDDEIITKYKVAGIESINGRKCFKVYAISNHKEYGKCKKYLKDLYRQNNTVIISRYFNNVSGVLWVDYSKRILVKAVFYDEERGRIIKMSLE